MKPHYTDKDIDIHKIKCGPYDNNAYILVCPQTNESIIIDTPSDPSVVVAIASTTTVKSIVITHNHMDHLLGFDEVTSAFDAPVSIGHDDASALSRPADVLLQTGSEITAGNITLEAIHTPGILMDQYVTNFRSTFSQGILCFPVARARPAPQSIWPDHREFKNPAYSLFHRKWAFILGTE
ncbi:MAG: hypothetical protein CM1200mP3_03270 [Chloroflexota bacterium]|nr:MAG: hypothetical protein CM1200mP3_03270 [Chloroflexota bacterium]